MVFNQKGVFSDKIDEYKELRLAEGGRRVKLSAVTTSHRKESTKVNHVRQPEEERKPSSI